MGKLLILLGASVTLCLFLIAVFVYFVMRLYSDIKSWRAGAPFVAIPPKIAREALRLAEVCQKDVVYDLGCGDARVLKLAVEEFGVGKAIGYEIALWPYISAKLKIQKSTIEVRKANLLQANLGQATVVFLFLTCGLLKKLREKLINDLPKGARIIVVTWGFKHPFRRPLGEKTVPWKLEPFDIYLFNTDGL